MENKEITNEPTPITQELKGKIETISKILLALLFTQTFTLCLLVWIALN